MNFILTDTLIFVLQWQISSLSQVYLKTFFQSPGESSSSESSPAQTPTVVEQQTLIQVESTRTETIKEEAVNEESTSSVENEDVRPYEPETPGIDVASALEAVRLAEKEAEDCKFLKFVSF